jgi:4,5-DOPA dioxygenase extradiol
MTAPMPSLFVGHGSPMNALTDNAFTRAWTALGKRIGRPSAILCVSAHWETEGTRVTGSLTPKTIHDFYGFPPALFAMEYKAPGAPALVQRLAALEGVHAMADESWGFDHGAWSVLKFLYPDADIPTVQLSLDVGKDGHAHFAMGRVLAPLRSEGVLLLGSGNVVHNLREFARHDETPLDWATQFNAHVKEKVLAGDYQGLSNYSALPGAARAIQGPEHYVPLLYVLGAAHPSEKPEFLTDIVQSSIAMTSVGFGL